MGLSDIVVEELASRTIRNVATNETGIREIGGEAEENEEGGFLSSLWNQAKNFFGWIMPRLAGIELNFSGLMNLIRSTSTFIYNFNWNATDEQLDQYINNMNLILSSQLGGTLGNTFGYLVCGIIPSAVMTKFNQALGLYLLKQVGEEALDEFMGNLSMLIQASFRLGVQAFVTNAFKNTRNTLKNYFRDPNSTQSKWLERITGNDKLQEAIQGWGEQGSKPWSFRQYVEDKIESIENQWVQNFVEEFYEEFLDACVEAGYVVAQGLDSWILQQQIQNQTILGDERIIEVTLDREAEDERIVLAGRDQLMRSDLPLILANYQMVENRDIGQFVGEPVYDSARREISLLTLHIELFSNPSPPFWTNGVQRASITISDVSRSKLDWETIKQACGGSNGYTYGRFRFNGNLSNKRPLTIYAASGAEAQKQAYKFASLSEASIIGETITEEIKSGQRANNKNLEKPTIQVYPAYVTIVNKQKILNEGTDNSGYPTLEGNYNRKSARIPLWTSQRPPQWNNIIQEQLRVPGID